MVLAIFCILMCACAFLLPERSKFFLNIDYLEYLSRNHKFSINSSPKTQSCFLNGCIINGLNDLENQFEKNITVEEKKYIYLSQPRKKLINQTTMLIQNEDCESSILANNLIKKINSENHSKNGKLNPIFMDPLLEEETCNFSLNNLNKFNSNKINFDSSTKF